MARRKREKSNWMRDNWRPVMAFVYMLIILFDFVVSPIFWSLLQAYFAGSVLVQWSPLTLGSGGVFHGAMGAILGVAAWTRGKEKMEILRQETAQSYSEEVPDNLFDQPEENNHHHHIDGNRKLF